MNKMVVFSGTANKKLSERISKSLKVKLGKIMFSTLVMEKLG